MYFFFIQGQSPSIRQLIMHSMAEWYMRGEQYDQAKLSRILDVAQDLKVCQNAPNCYVQIHGYNIIHLKITYRTI